VPIASKTFKTALSRWTSGVTIITSRAPTGALGGLTASSFTSLSLEPPLVLFCLGLASRSLEVFRSAEGFAVNILSREQQPLADRFASRSEDPFAGVDHAAGRMGMPILPDSLAILECRTLHQFPGGDHLILVGEVEEVTLGEGSPLVYWRGQYQTL
jgi:flavin reductase ActVB